MLWGFMSKQSEERLEKKLDTVLATVQSIQRNQDLMKQDHEHEKRKTAKLEGKAEQAEDDINYMKGEIKNLNKFSGMHAGDIKKLKEFQATVQEAQTIRKPFIDVFKKAFDRIVTLGAGAIAAWLFAKLGG